MKEIVFKNKTWSLVLGIGLLFLLSPFIITGVSFLVSPETELASKIIIVVVGGMLLFMPVAMAVLCIIDYFEVRKKLQARVIKYGKDNLIENIRNHTVSEYSSPLGGAENKVYFTDRFIINPAKAIIEYSEISMLYKHVSRVKFGYVSSIAFELSDGTSRYLCDFIDDEQIREYMELCHQYNPDILFGYNKENLKKHKEQKNSPKNFPATEKSDSDKKNPATEKSDSGKKNTATEKSNFIQRQLTPEGRKYHTGARMFYGGLIMTLIMIPMFVGVSLIIILQGNVIVNAFVTLAILFAVFLPEFIVCLLLVFFGKRLMKKYADAAGEYEEAVTVISL